MPSSSVQTSFDTESLLDDGPERVNADRDPQVFSPGSQADATSKMHLSAAEVGMGDRLLFLNYQVYEYIVLLWIYLDFSILIR